MSMIKILNFSEPLPGMILSGEKTATWRIDDAKKRDVQIGDSLSLCRNDGKEFAMAVATEVFEKKFSELTEKDKQGHEKYASDKEMYGQFSKWYKKKVNGDTIVKVIKFRL